MATRKPVILLMQVKAKPRPEYLVVAPLFMEGFDDGERQFTLATQPADVVTLDAEVFRSCVRSGGPTAK